MTEETSSTSSSDNSNDFIELDVPIYVELKQSLNGNDLGTFSRVEIGADQFLGSYKGKHKKSISQCADPNYVWTILSSRQMPLFYIDASDPSDSNWLRFIRSTSDPNKYNVICMQQNQQINYFTFKSIKQGEELTTYLPGKRKKPKNKAYANLSYKLYENQMCPDNDLPEEAEDKGQEGSSETPLDADEPSIDEAVELKLCDDIRKREDYFFSIGFSLKLKNMKKSVKRQLTKCDLCSYAVATDSRLDYDKIIKTHVIDQHLSKREECQPTDQIVEEVCESMIRQLEGPAHTENTFDYYFTFCPDKSKHELLDHSLRCFYCSFEAQCDQEGVTAYFKHLAKLHQHEIRRDQLVSDIDESELTDHDLAIINWPDYFRLSFRDNKFPSDKLKSAKTWTCHLCKKQFDQRIDLSKHQCIELSLKLLKKKKELRKKKWKETHWKRKIDLSYIETSTLSQISSNICDNLTFCVDGTQQDLKSYSKEVKDYLNSHLNKETQAQMALKCCFPDFYAHILKQLGNVNESSAAKLIQDYLLDQARDYFTDSLHCGKCCKRFDQLSAYKDHLKIKHQDEKVDTGPVGFVSCDLIAYLLNIYWDSTLMLACSVCGEKVVRAESARHYKQCVNKDNEGYLITEEIVGELIDGMVSEPSRSQKKRVASGELDAEETKKRVLNAESSEESRPVRRTTRSSLGSSAEPQVHLFDALEKQDKKNQTGRANSRARTKTDHSGADNQIKKEAKTEFMSVKVVNNKKIHTCDKCDLEFTSSNSVTRHQEKSCLRVKVISFESKSKSKSKSGEIKKKCPICGFIFSNTHQLSIHIYRQHKSLLGSANDPATDQAIRLNQEQLKKLMNESESVSENEDDQAMD